MLALNQQSRACKRALVSPFISLMCALLVSVSLYANPRELTSEALLERLKQAKLNEARASYELGRARLNLSDERPQSTQEKSTEEVTGDFDIQEISASFIVNDFNLPRRGTFSVTFTSRVEELTSVRLLRAYEPPARLWIIRDGAQVPLEFTWDPEEALLEVTLPLMSVGEEETIWIRTPIAYNFEDSFGQLETPSVSHYVGIDMLPVNYDHIRGDRYRLATEFEVESPGVYPNAQGLITVSGNANTGLGSWRFETEGTTFVMAITYTDRPLTAYSPRVDMTSPGFMSGITEPFFGFLADEIINSYESLVAPFPFNRFSISTLSVEAGVAIAPLGMILMPDDYWTIDAQTDDISQWYLESLMAHEIGHQYFPHLVHLQDGAPGWLSEAFAEFLSGLHMRAIYSHDHLFEDNHWRYMYFELPFGQPEPSVVSDELYTLDVEAYFTILYARGSSVLYQLSRRYENFNEVLLSYVNDHQGRLVNLEDFIGALESYGQLSNSRSVGFSLDAYLDAYLYGSERLSVDVRAHYISDEASFVSVIPSASRPDTIEINIREHTEEGLNTVRAYFPLGPIEYGIEHQAVFIDPGREYFLEERRRRPNDIDLNGVVDGLDALEVLAREGLNVDISPSNVRGSPQSFARVCDLNRDRVIDQDDLDILLDDFGAVELSSED